MRVASRALVSWFFALSWSGHALAQSTLSAGGLAPPPAVESKPAPDAQPGANPQPGGPTSASTEAQLDRADAEDSGRGLEFVWLNAEAGVIHVGLNTFHQKNLLDPLDVKTNETGLVTGAGVGLRLVFVTVGARFRYALMPDYSTWSLGLEGGVHAPFGNLEPYATLDASYIALGNFRNNLRASVKGFDARLGGGVDYYLAPMFSVGVNVSADLLFLHRSSLGIPTPAGLCPTGPAVDYCSSGSSIGGALSATAVAGLHF
jgi:hypothetical protein